MNDKKNQEVFQKAIQIALHILERAAQCVAYKQEKPDSVSGWSNEFCRKELDKAFSGYGYFKTKPYYDQEFWDDVMKLPNDMRILLGFQYFSKEKDPKMLIPLWIVKALPEGVSFMAECIDGKTTSVITKDFKDLSTKGGCIAYMI